MDTTTTFPISADRPSRVAMTLLGAGPKVSRVQVSASTVDVRMGWAFQASPGPIRARRGTQPELLTLARFE